jgi:outer membrane protein TolC
VHQEALSRYKNQLYQFKIQEKNKQLAEEIFEVVSMQYEAGIKNFLEVIVAETDLRVSRINYTRALFAVLTSKLEVERTRGTLLTDY